MNNDSSCPSEVLTNDDDDDDDENEQQSLIQKEKTNDNSMISIIEEKTLDMVWTILKKLIPAIFAAFFELFPEAVNTIIAGHLGDPSKIAGLGLANISITILALASIIGTNSAILTFVS